MKSIVVGAICAAAALTGVAQATELSSVRERPAEDEIVYFVLPDRFANGDVRNDRGGLRGDRLQTGFDPTHKGFYHGGDLAGLIEKLDYIQGMGATAIWLAPIFKNKPVQGPPGQESAGYHGYWVTDFTDIDPHFGTRAEFKRFVDAAHARGMKVYMDIITNHSADVIQYRGCPIQACDYRSRADYPYQRRGGVGGPAINAGFMGDDAARQTAENFSKLTDPNYAYDVFVPPEEKDVKRPAWLNDPIYYHNRGNFADGLEPSTFGDFAGLDDLFTEHPRVVAGFIDIFGAWIDDFGIDGFRIDTARHVNPEFWQAFVPAMKARAAAKGIPHFHIFGEVFDPDPAVLARHTKVDGFPAVLDFAFQSAVTDVVARGKGTRSLSRIFAADPIYAGGEGAARTLPTFLGNHDMGRFALFVKQARPEIGDEEWSRRIVLAHAMMMFSRGSPVIYSGDEQGFVGDGNDQDAREDMFPSKVASYNDNDLVGTSATTATANYDTQAFLYRALADMAKVRREHAPLRRGRQFVRADSAEPGLFAISRMLDGEEILIAFNTASTPLSARVMVDAQSRGWTAVRGACAAKAPGSVEVSVPALDYVICRGKGES